MICLDLENKDVKDWVTGVGIDDTYKQFILHNYKLPKYKVFQQKRALASLSSTQVEDVLNNVLNLNNYSIESIDKIHNMSRDALAAFMGHTFYFAKSANLLQVNEEAFHAIFQTLTSTEDRQKLFVVAEELLNQRLRKNNLSKTALLERFERVTNLKGQRLYEYVLEEELASEWVSWATYDNALIRQSSLRSIWNKKDASFIDKVIETLSNFFQKLRELVSNIGKAQHLKHYFNKIKKGEYRLDNPILENDNGYTFPSLSPIILEGKDGQFILDTLQQQLHYSKIHGIYSQLHEKIMFMEDGKRPTTSYLLDQAIDIYRDNILQKAPKNSEEQAYYEMLVVDEDGEFEARTQTFSEIRERIQKANLASEEELEVQDKVEDEMGGAFNDFQSDTANMIDRFSSLPRKIKQMMFTIPVFDTGTELIQKEFTQNGKTETIDLQTYRMADPHRIYAAIVRATTNSINEFDRLKKIVLFSEDSVLNSDTNAFVEHFLKRSFGVATESLEDLKETIKRAHSVDAFLLKGSLYTLKDVEHFATVLKAFDLWTRPNFISVENIKEAEDGGMNFNPHMTNVEGNQIGKWYENWATKKKTKTQLRVVTGRLKDVLFLGQELENPTYAGLRASMVKSLEHFDAITDFLGVEVSKTFLKYAVTDVYVKSLVKEADQSKIPQDFMEVYNSFQLSDSEFRLDLPGMSQAFTKIMAAVDAGTLDIKDWNPYEVSFDAQFDEEGNPLTDEGIMSKIKPLAKGNAYFDESVLSSTFLNSDGKNIYAHQSKTLSLYIGNYVLKSEKNILEYYKEILDSSVFNRHTAGPGNMLFDYYLSLSDREKSRLNVTSYAGVKVAEYKNGKKLKDLRTAVNEVTSKDFVAVQANTAIRDLYISKKAQKENDKYIAAAKLTTKYFLGYPEASNTKTFFSGVWSKGDEINGQFIPYLKTDNTLSLTGIDEAYKFVEQQGERISDIWEFLNLWDLRNSNFQTNKKGETRITEDALRKTPMKDGTLFKGNIVDGLHTGWIKLTEEGIDTEHLASNLRIVPRGLTVTTSLNGFLDKESDKKLVYDKFLYGQDTEKQIKESVRKGINSLLAQADKNLASNLYASEYWGMGDEQKLNFLGFKKAKKEIVENEAGVKREKSVKDKKIFQYNQRLFFLNSLFNREAFHRFTAGDSAVNNKNDFLDQSKRLKGAEGQVISAHTTIPNSEKGVGAFTELKIVQMVEAAKALQKDISGVTGQAIDSDDAQSYTSVNHRRHLLHGLKKLDNDLVYLLDKLQSGRDFTAQDDKKILDDGLLLNVEKTRGFGPGLDLKTSEFMLSKNLTSLKNEVYYTKDELDMLINEISTMQGTSYIVKPQKGATKEVTVEYDKTKYNRWQSAHEANDIKIFQWTPSSVYLHEKRLLLDGWRYKGGEWIYTGEEINVISPTSAHKRKKQNIWNGNPAEFETYNEHISSTMHYGRQVENPAHDKITDPSQELEIITSSLNDQIVFKDASGKVIIRSKEDVISNFYNLLENRDTNTFSQALNELTDADGDPYLKIFYEKIQETLQETGGDRQLIELFGLDEDGSNMYNPNIQIVKNKFENYFFSHFSKGVLAQKVKGDALAMISPRGYSLLKRLVVSRRGNEYLYTWDVIQKSDPRYNEYYAQVKQDFTMAGLSYNGYTANNKTSVESHNTLIPELDKLEAGDFFLDELRHLVPEIEAQEELDSNLIPEDKETVISGYFSEVLIPKRDVKQKSLDKSWQFIHGVRIPSQDKATSANLKIVDMLETSLSNSIMATKEIQELAGSDFDIDKLYAQFVDGFWQNGTFYPYARTGKRELNFEMFKDYIFKNNKTLKKAFKELTKTDEKYQNYLAQMAELKAEFTAELKEIGKENQKIKVLEEEILPLLSRKDKTQDEWTFLKDLSEGLQLLKKEAKESKLYERKDSALTKIAEIDIQMQTVKGIIENKLLFENNLPYTAHLYAASSKEHNTGLINNQLLNYKIALLTNKIEAYSNTTDVGSLKDVDKTSDLGILRDREAEEAEYQSRLEKEPELKRADVVVYRKDFHIEPYIPYHSPLFDEYYGTKIQAAKVGIGASVNGNLTYLVLSRLNAQLNPAYQIEMQMEQDDDVITFFEYAESSPEYGPKSYDISRWISTLVSVTTDEGKEGVLAKYNILGDLLAIFATGQQIGIHPEILVALVNNPVLQEYAKESIRNPLQVKKQDSLLALINAGMEPFKDADETIDIETLKDNLTRTDTVPTASDYSTLKTAQKLLKLYNQNRDLVKFIRLKRGFDATYSDFVELTAAAQRLGIDTAPFYKERKDELPVVAEGEVHDVYNLKEYYDNPQISQIRNYVDEVIPKVYDLANKLLIEGNANYRKIYNNVAKNFEVYSYKKADFDKEVETALMGELIGDDPSYNLSIDLVVGEQSLAKRLLDLIAEDLEKPGKHKLKDYPLFKKLTARVGLNKALMEAQRRNPKLKREDLLDTIKKIDVDTLNLNLFAKLAPELQSSLMDDFQKHSLSRNPKVKAFVKDLFNYYIVKDGMRYSPTGLSKIFPTYMFEDISQKYDEFLKNTLSPEEITEWSARILERLINDTRLSEFMHTLPTMDENFKSADTFPIMVEGAQKEIPYWRLKSGSMFILRKPNNPDDTFIKDNFPKGLPKAFTKTEIEGENPSTYVQVGAIAKGNFIEYIYLERPAMGSKGVYSTLAKGNFSFSTMRLTKIRANLMQITDAPYQMYIVKHLNSLRDLQKVQIPYTVNKEAIDYYFRNSTAKEFVRKVNELLAKGKEFSDAEKAYMQDLLLQLKAKESEIDSLWETYKTQILQKNPNAKKEDLEKTVSEKGMQFLKDYLNKCYS